MTNGFNKWVWMNVQIIFPAEIDCQGIPNKDPTVQLDGAIPAK